MLKIRNFAMSVFNPCPILFFACHC